MKHFLHLLKIMSNGKMRELIMSSSSDTAWARTSVTAAKPHHVQEQPLGSAADQEHGQTGPANRVRHISQGASWQFAWQFTQGRCAHRAQSPSWQPS